MTTLKQAIPFVQHHRPSQSTAAMATIRHHPRSRCSSQLLLLAALLLLHSITAFLPSFSRPQQQGGRAPVRPLAAAAEGAAAGHAIGEVLPERDPTLKVTRCVRACVRGWRLGVAYDGGWVTGWLADWRRRARPTMYTIYTHTPPPVNRLDPSPCPPPQPPQTTPNHTLLQSQPPQPPHTPPIQT